MSLPLAEYRAVRSIRESSRSSVYEAVCERDGRVVVAKVFDIEDEADEDRVAHEFELIRSLDIEGVVRPQELRRVGDQLILLLEHVPGVNLAEYADGKPLPLDSFYSIATQLADTLARVHAARVIHRDIKPTNVLVDTHAQRVYLADFGISVLLENERRHIYDSHVFVGTLPYISPEQTGRTGHAVDFRSDLYSLGVSFYQLLTGRLPFESLAPLELIHAHLARHPQPPEQLRRELPLGLSRLVMKLLTKAPERRYQTAAGLAADLRKLQAAHASGQDDADIELGSEDLPTTLRLPHQLYGRTREQAQLDEALASVAESGGRRTVALLGPAGVGKSALVRDLEAAVVGRGGYMLHGKFDAYLEQPYSGFAEAFTGFFEQLLTESDARLGRWRKQLLAGMGRLGGVLAELCPTFELVAGPQHKPAQLDATEARNRLQLSVERLLRVICADERPAVLVLEDVHWAGQESVRVLEAIVHAERGPLLVLVTLRPDELVADHPLRALASELSGHPRVAELRLGGLSEPAIEALIADALPNTAELGALARVVARKTGGVPLFIAQFLTRLSERGVLRASRQGWVWDRAAVESEPIPDDAVAVMSAKLEAVSSGARDLITRAACFGARFDRTRLSSISDQARGRLTASLVELEQSGLLVRIGSGWSFAHDSIREAAQQRLDPELRRQLRWTIGRELQASLAYSDEHLFEVVDHLDAGAPAQPDEALLVELAQLNLRAGQRALDAAAWDHAHGYLVHGIALTAGLRDAVIARGAAAPSYELVFRLHFWLAYALALAGRRGEADGAFAELLGWKLEQHHYAEVVARRVRLLWLETRSDEAVRLGLEALARLGTPVPRSPGNEQIRHTLVEAWELVRGLDLDTVLGMAARGSERDAAIIDVVAQLKYAAFAVNNGLYLLLSGLHPLFMLERGDHPTRPQAIGDLALGVSGELGEVADAVRILDLAVALAEREATATAKARVLAVSGGMSLHRGRPFADIVALHDANYQGALEAGEFDPASFIAGFGADMQLEIGTHLRVLERRCQRVTRDVGRWSPKQMRVLIAVVRGISRMLLGSEGEGGIEQQLRAWTTELEHIVNAGVSTGRYVALIARALVELVLGDHEAALATCVRFVHDADRILFNTWFVARAAVLTCVAYHAGLLAGGTRTRKLELVVSWSIEMLEGWARDAPANYAHGLDLIVGMQAAVEGQSELAVRRLDSAWKRARLHGCRWVEGLAAEQLAALLEREGLDSLVDGARQRAWQAYAAWGAGAKLQLLREAYPELPTEPGDRREGRGAVVEGASSSGSSSSSTPSTPALDLAGVLRSVGAITENLRLEEVIERILDAAATSVGAERALLVLDQAGELALVAEAEAVGERRIFADPPLLRDAVELAPTSLINFVVRTGQSVVLDDAREDLRFAGDVYLERAEIRSVLAMPLLKGERKLGALVLENRLTTHGFTSTSVQALQLIIGQAASTLENAQLYAALRRSEARWRSLVDGAPDLIALLDERGRIVFRNHDGPLIGIDEGEEDSEGGALARDSLIRWRDTVEAVLDDGERRELELEYIPREGPVRWYAVRLAPIEVHRALSSEAQVVHRNAVVVATDISARRQAEAEKQQLEAQLRQQQRLESIGTLASGVAHEINNPIQGIMNYADLIYSNSSERALVEEFAGEIMYESNRVATIVRNLLAFSRQEASAKPERARLGEVVEASLSLVRTVLRGDHIEVALTVEPELPQVRCRVQQIQQVVMNLVTNARDALNERYGQYHEHKRIDIRVARSPRAGWIRVAVRDFGPGIPVDVLPRIFDPFFTTKGRDQGTGLGLAVSHGIVQDHGGELEVETELGAGTCFSLDLPIVRSTHGA